MGDLLPLNLYEAPTAKGVEATCLAEAALSEGCEQQTSNSYIPMLQSKGRAAISGVACVVICGTLDSGESAKKLYATAGAVGAGFAPAGHH